MVRGGTQEARLEKRAQICCDNLGKQDVARRPNAHAVPTPQCDTVQTPHPPEVCLYF